MYSNLKSLLSILVLCVLCGCGRPEKYAIYKNLRAERIRVQVLYVGKNYEIKDAVDAGELEDSGSFHSPSFWNDKRTLVVYDIGWISYTSLEEFEHEYKLVK